MGSTNLSTKRQRIAELARTKPGVALSTLHHVIDLEWLKEAHRLTRKDGAPGIDGVTAADYDVNLEANLLALLERIKSGSYVAPPVRRVGGDNQGENSYCLTQLCSRGFSLGFASSVAMTRHGRQRGPEKLISDMPSPSFRAQGRSRSAGTQVLRQTPTLPGRTLTAPSTVGRSWQLGMRGVLRSRSVSECRIG